MATSSSDSNLRYGPTILVLIVFIISVIIFCFGPAILSATSKQDPSDCTSSQKYDSSKQRCREKTSSEVAAEVEAARKAKLETDVKNGKQNGTVCLSAAESWSNIGKTTCVVFHPEYFYRTGYGYLFLNEKEDYKNGFVAFFAYRNMLSWNDFLARYRTIDNVAVYGTI